MPSTERTTSPRIAIAAVVLLLPALAVPASQASARPDAGGPTTLGRPGPATTRTHDLAPANKVRGVGALSRADAAEARGHARGRAVEVVSATGAIDLPELAVVGVTWDAGSTPGGTVQYRTEEAGSWSEWRFVEAEGDHAPDPAEAKQAAAKTGGSREGSAPLITTDADEIQVRIIAEVDSSPVDAQLMVVEPGTPTTPSSTTTTTTQTPTNAVESTVAATTDAVATVAKPTIYTRAQWGADESVRDPSEPDYGVVDAAVVHHTAGSNSYTEGQVPSIIQGIYEYHVTGHGWRDIGYNFLVDRFGRIWEGRHGGMDKAVVGAHAEGVNSVMFGASVLGDFETVQPPSAVMTALRNLIAWKAAVHHVDVLGTTVVAGTTYNTISGHRNVNATECPGQYLYAKLPELRTATAALAPSATRIGGADRFIVAAAASASTFAPGAPIAYIATGTNFPDALAAGPVGGHRGGPVLLTKTDQLVTPTINELKRLKPQRIVILGGPASVSDAVAKRLYGYEEPATS
ncbi:cell wall-binding repeat-containing protein [Intrasporangium sp.]|uniref:cell wall-binding repeat-containing protein n=1 Tax=Intrasporangium sp. TaxID=1925024 RepID=UPI0033658E14